MIAAHYTVMQSVENRVLPLQGAIQLQVINKDGHLRVTTGEGDKITFQAVKKVKSEDETLGRHFLEVLRIDSRLEGDRWILETIPPRDPLFENRNSQKLSWSVDYEIRIPPHFRFEARNGDGKIEVAGAASVNLRAGDGNLTVRQSDDVTIRSGDGNIRVENAEGSVSIASGDGDIAVNGAASVHLRAGDGRVSVENCLGAAEIQNGDGRVSIRGHHGALQVRSGDSKVDAELAEDSRPSVDVQIGDGTLQLRLPQSVSAHLQAQTGEGTIDIDPAIGITRRDRHRLEGNLGSGDGSIRLRTGDGMIGIHLIR